MYKEENGNINLEIRKSEVFSNEELEKIYIGIILDYLFKLYLQIEKYSILSIENQHIQVKKMELKEIEEKLNKNNKEPKKK